MYLLMEGITFRGIKILKMGHYMNRAKVIFLNIFRIRVQRDQP